MTAQINLTLTIAKQDFDELVRLRSIKRLKQQDFGEGAQEIIDHPLVGFRPDEWHQNLRLLEPVLSGQPKTMIPQRIQLRLFNAYQGFVINQWFGVIALSRAILEDAILTRAVRLGINLYSTSPDGKRSYFKLGKLIYLVSKKHPRLKNDMETIKRAGDRILHPKKPDVTSHPCIFRIEALECLQGIKRIVEYVYSGRPIITVLVNGITGSGRGKYLISVKLRRKTNYKMGL